ncbi:MAG: hypothetical protein IJJ38_00270 [Lachnospiraceae bacterium]|nr:hypothetical protein [Lachnospiraceae bacterium]
MNKIFALMISAAVGCGMLAGCGNSTPKVDGTQTLLTAGEDTVSLGTASFYAKFEQAQLYKYWGSYFGQTGEIFDTVTDSSTEETYGESMKESVLEDLKKMLVMEQHAGEYDVALSDEEKSEISGIAETYVNSNTEEVLSLVGASKEDVERLLTLQTIQSRMRDPLVVDVDTNVPDDEVQQSRVSYIAAAVSDDGDDKTDDAAAAEELAKKALEAVKGASSAAEADFEAIAADTDKSLQASTGTFGTNDSSDSYLDAALLEAVSGLKDGALVDHVVKAEDGNTFYVVRLDTTFDKDATESERASVINERKQEKYDEILDKWVEEADIQVNEEAWKTVVITDKAPVTLKDPASEAESTEESAEEAEAESAEESAEAAEAESAEESAEAAEAESAESAAESEAESSTE